MYILLREQNKLLDAENQSLLLMGKLWQENIMLLYVHNSGETEKLECLVLLRSFE